MKKTIEIEVDIPKGYMFEAFRTPRKGEHYIFPLDGSIKTVLNNEPPITQSFVVLKKPKPVLRVFELYDSCGHAKSGDNYSKLSNGPIKQWCFNSTSAAFFYIWKEIKSEEGVQDGNES